MRTKEDIKNKHDAYITTARHNATSVCNLRTIFFNCLQETMTTSEAPHESLLKKNGGNGEKDGNQYFLLFLQWFYSMKEEFYVFSHILFVACKYFQLVQG